MISDDKPAAAVLHIERLSLIINNVTKVSDVSFRLRAGERVCLIGESGSGKSLTASAIIGSLPANCRISGRIRINGGNVTGRHALARQPACRVAAIFQDSATALNPLMTLNKQLALAGVAATTGELDDLLNHVGLGGIPDLLQRFPAELSGGQRQRICLQLALKSRSPLLIADEPTSSLDVITQQQVLRLLQKKSVQDAPALLFITHDIALASQLCQRGLVMENGRIVESGSLAELLTTPRHSATQHLVEAALRSSASLNRMRRP